MDKKKIHKRGKPKRARESDSNNNNTAQDDDTQTTGKKAIRLAGAQMGATSTDTMAAKDDSEEPRQAESSSSSSGHSLSMTSTFEKIKHVSFEDLSEKSGSTSSQSKSSESSLQTTERSAKCTAAAHTEGGSTTPAASKTILKKRKRNAKRRAKKIAAQAVNAIKTEETVGGTRNATDDSKFATQEIPQNEPKLKFSDDVLQIAERTTARKAKPQRQRELEDAAFVPENIEIAARFKQIMDMFDNFTKNLESLELPPSPRSEVGAKALTKPFNKKNVIPLGWKDCEIGRNEGSNIEISITEKADKQKDDTSAVAVEEFSVCQTAVRDIKVGAETEEVKIEMSTLRKAQVSETSALPNRAQQCEVKDWKTGIRESKLRQFENKKTEEMKDPKTLQIIAKEKLEEKFSAHEIPPSDISKHEISAVSTQNAAAAIEPKDVIDQQNTAVRALTVPAIVETKILTAAPKITASNVDSVATNQIEQLQHTNVRACVKEFEVDKKLKQKEVDEKKEITQDSLQVAKPKVNENTDFVIEMEENNNPENDFLTEEFEIWKMHHNIYPTGLPKWRQGLQNLASVSAKKIKTQQLTKEVAVPAMLIQKDIATSTALDESAITALNELPCQTVSCQTSLHLQNAAQEQTPAATTPTVLRLADSVTVDSTVDDATSTAHLQTAETDCKVETYMVLPPPDENKTCGKLGPSVSRQALVKESPSLLDLPRVLTIRQQPERTFHTIHIDTTSTPSPSVMQRPPLGQRCWTVVTDFFSAICVCLQVNRDCIFCLGFFIAFVVSASFLTAFFYRTLSITPQIIHSPQTHIQPVSRGNNYNYY